MLESRRELCEFTCVNHVWIHAASLHVPFHADPRFTEREPSLPLRSPSTRAPPVSHSPAYISPFVHSGPRRQPPLYCCHVFRDWTSALPYRPGRTPERLGFCNHMRRWNVATVGGICHVGATYPILWSRWCSPLPYMTCRRKMWRDETEAREI